MSLYLSASQLREPDTFNRLLLLHDASQQATCTTCPRVQPQCELEATAERLQRSSWFWQLISFWGQALQDAQGCPRC